MTKGVSDLLRSRGGWDHQGAGAAAKQDKGKGVGIWEQGPEYAAINEYHAKVGKNAVRVKLAKRGKRIYATT